MNLGDNDNQINEIIKKMSLKEKIGQLNQTPIDTKNTEVLAQKVREGKVGSIILSDTPTAGNDKQEEIKHKLLNEFQRIAIEESVCGIPIIYGRDIIHGHNTVFPIPLAMAASFNSQLIKESYQCIAKEAKNDGVHWTFTPMLDVARDPRWGRCIEGPGEDPYVGMRMAQAVVEGFQGDLTQEYNMAACAKHYIGYGASEGGRDYHKTEISNYTLKNYYLKAFKQAVDSGVLTVMNSFNEISGQPTSSSHYLLTELLKEELGFDGFVVSDWGAVGQLVNQGVAIDYAGAAQLSINAGIDMDMADDCYIDHMEQLVKDGLVREEVIDEAVRRILRVKMAIGLFEKPYLVSKKLDRFLHTKKATELAEEAMVLLKNKNNILPFTKLKMNCITVIGPMSNQGKQLFGSWTLDGIENEVVTILDGIKQAAGEIQVIDRNSTLTDEMLMTVRHHYSDAIVLVLGESHECTGEARSLCDIELPEEQQALIKRVFALGRPIIGVMAFGRPIAMESVEHYFDAILYSWHAGTYTGTAVGNILFGHTAPSGRLPMSMPRRTGQIPIYYNPPSSGRFVNGYYGQGGCYEDCLGSPLYQFGYGLSYTDFEYGEITIQEPVMVLDELEAGKKITITITVKNVGEVSAKEVVQCYIHDCLASMTRPIKELKGFEKILLNPKEEKTVTFYLGKEELGFYNGQGEFVVEKGQFEVFVGPNCYAKEKQLVTIL